MKNSDSITIITVIARDILGKFSPKELPIFPEASRAYFVNPTAALRQFRSKDNVLGFGMDPLAVLLTPVVLHVLSEAYEFLAGIAEKAVEAALAKEIPELVRAMFKKYSSSGKNAPSALTKEQVGKVHSNILQAAKQLRLSEGKAKIIANAVTAQIILQGE